MRELIYNRLSVVNYARKWAFERNPAYYDFENLGGDCTNFASQCIYAGAGVMNPTPTIGWYYYSLNNRTPSWTGVEYLYNFLVNNKGVGPYGKEVTQREAEVGDVLQLGDENGHFYHTPVIVGKMGNRIFVAAHTYDAYMRPLDDYVYENVRFIHILGVRTY
ncbi:MAG: amidase domain-containing protein [Clostridiales bacterium]|nr:amidase domain-containing protein [Clostridiales bacterium]